tara:strand:+ start:31219 stop:33636 length:2418 start_codon:yes stop_codon:yes gene_type:complete
MKKIKLLILCLIIIYSCTNSTVNEVSSYRFLPDDSKIILKINDLTNTLNILNENKLMDNVLINKDLILSQLKSLSENKNEGNGLLSMSTFGKNEIAFTFIREIDDYDSIIKSNFSKRNYQGHNIFYDNSNSREIYKVTLDNYVVSSSEDIVLENIIRNFKIKNLKLDNDLLKIVRTIDQDQPFNIFSKSENLNTLVNIYGTLALYPSSNSSWIGYDFNYSISNLFLTGVTRIKDSINGKLSFLKNISPKEIKTDKIIPNSFKSFLTITISDSERFVFNLKEYLKLNDISSDNLKFNSINLIDEISFVLDQEKFIILKINNPDLLNTYFDLDEFDSSNKIMKIDFNDDLLVLFENIQSGTSLKYSILIDDNLVITESLSQIKKIINSSKINDNLGSNNEYNQYISQKAKKLSFVWINNNKTLSNTKKNDINPDNYPFISFSGRVNQDIALIDFDISKIENIDKSGDIFTEFFLTFDDKITLPPRWILNHTNNEYDFIFQDDDNYLNYYSNKGILNWRKQIPQKIIGDVNQIDLYKNGRKQIIFRTLNSLYVFDRNGIEVKELTFEIGSANVHNPISIFDYEKNRNYRFLITNDNLIQMFDSSGKIVKGFKPKKFTSNIIQRPVHIRIKGKDYILILLENGSLKILDRRGRDRIVVDDKIRFSNNSFYSYLNSFTTIDLNGNLIKVDTNGKISRDYLNLSESTLIDISDNSLVYIDNNMLSIKGISINLPFGNYSRPKIFKILNQKIIAITDLNEEKIFLYDENGQLFKGFPIKGSSLIDIIDSDNDNKFEIITQLDDNSIVSYEVN